jgi:ATP-dependent RNA circularization protein (DNA/RNA ligase family)
LIIKNLDISKEKKEYIEQINNINWKSIKIKFNTFPESKKKYFISKIEKVLLYEIEWKKEILYEKFLIEIK